MGLLGKAAMILSFDIEEGAIAEHDDWHSHEHLQERMSIPGFLRGSRWISVSSAPHYFVRYEVDDLDTLVSKPYLDRLNNPSAWTARMMSHYRGMKRGFCRLVFSSGNGLGIHGLLLRLSPNPTGDTALRDWLTQEALPVLTRKPGLVGTHLFEASLAAEMTEEQRIRGKDSGLDWVLLITGYDAATVAVVADTILSFGELERQGAINQISGIYQLVHSLSAIEITNEQ